MKTRAILALFVALILLIPAIGLNALPGKPTGEAKMTTQLSFKNLVTGKIINSQLDPQAIAVLEKAAEGSPPKTIPEKRAAFRVRKIPQTLFTGWNRSQTTLYLASICAKFERFTTGNGCGWGIRSI